MAVGRSLLILALALVQRGFGIGQEDGLYLPPLDSQGPKPPSSTFNFLNPPQSFPSASTKYFGAKENVALAQSCTPPPLDELVLQSSWHPIKRGDTLYPIIAHSKRNEREQFIGHGKCPTALQGNDQDCVTFQWNSAGNEVTLTSFDGCNLQRRVSKCRHLHAQRFLVRCTFENNVTITQNIVKTDGQIWMLGYECWTKEDGSPGQVSWSVYSLYRTLPNSLRKELLGYVKDLGFDPVDSREPSYDNCPPILDAYPELRTYPESDKSLLKPSPQVCLPPSNTLPIESWRPEKKDDLLYLPLVFAQSDPGISAGYVDERNSESCSVQSGLKRRKQCLGLKFDSARFATQFQYHDGCERTVLNATCRQVQSGKIATSCEQADGLVLRQYAVFGDNHTYLLMYECWNRSRKPVTWSLRSVSPVIPESLKRLVLSRVEVLGFDSRDYREPSYSNCPALY